MHVGDVKPMNINEARAVITGGASGLGNAVARHIVAAGGKVALLGILPRGAGIDWDKVNYLFSFRQVVQVGFS